MPRFSGETAKQAARKSAESRSNWKSMSAAVMKEATPERRQQLAQTFLDNFGRSPKWAELVLRLMGELPPA